MKEYFSYFIKNGFYIPVIHLLSSKFIGNFLSSTICNQLYTINYFFWFNHLFNFGIPKQYNILKQFINFTYSGNLAMYLYCFFPDFLPVCHNIHFIITFSYWVGKFFYNCSDTDDLYHPDVSTLFTKVWSQLGHILPYILCLIEMKKEKDIVFNYSTLCYTCLWTYAWAILIYIPWRITTGDYVYSILQYLNFKKIVEYLITIHIIIVGSNISGYYLN